MTITISCILIILLHKIHKGILLAAAALPVHTCVNMYYTGVS